MVSKDSFFSKDNRTAFDAKCEAQRIAFAPMIFQACRVMLDAGILEAVQAGGNKGILLNELVSKAKLSRYGVKVLVESGLGIGLFCVNEGRFTLTKLGHFLLRDPMTRVNMGMVHDVCYQGLFHLEDAVREGCPSGLKTFGDWKTIYEGLSSLSPQSQGSWFEFDHYYSDGAFPAALPLVFADKPKRLLDVGGNTGRWAVECLKHDPDVRVTIADLPMQLEFARNTMQEVGANGRVDYFPLNALDESASFPEGHDVIWMSQFLDCFSEGEIVSILRRAAKAMTRDSALHILELFWDRQPNETAAFCLQQTSLYFTCIANGNSQMYHSADLLRCLAESGLRVVEQRDQVGQYHTWLKCRLA